MIEAKNENMQAFKKQSCFYGIEGKRQNEAFGRIDP